MELRLPLLRKSEIPHVGLWFIYLRYKIQKRKVPWETGSSEVGSPVHRLDFWGKESSLPPSPKFSLQFGKYREHGVESDSL